MPTVALLHTSSRLGALWAGVGTTLDLDASLDRLLTWENADDVTALAGDWAMIGVDFRRAVAEIKRDLLEQLSEGEQTPRLFDPDQAPVGE